MKLNAVLVDQNDFVCYLNSNNYSVGFNDVLALGIGAEHCVIDEPNILSNIDKFIAQNQDAHLFGFINYDLKNNIEKLTSKNPDFTQFPTVLLVKPRSTHNSSIEIENTNPSIPKIDFKARVNREEYINTVEKLQEHIREGDFYEINYCIEFYAEEVFDLNMFDVYCKLNEISPMPFSCFLKHNHLYIASASPERFIKKAEDKLISQPIKGTARRNASNEKDALIKEELYNSEKERAENLMIVDLVRNDLNRCAVPCTVEVDELFGIHTFPQVHQMISTISCRIAEERTFGEILNCTFPMGSMTGAPKIRAMEMIEYYEKSRRGIFSGSVGHISPNRDFDFNVIIRSLFYNAQLGHLSFQVGSAITLDSDPAAEYDECMLKAQAILKTFGN